jgi:hypothetical protein
MKYLAFFGVLIVFIGCGTKKEVKKDGTELFTHDFEEGDLRGWTTTGDAFSFQPTLGDNPYVRRRGQPAQHQGKYWIGTYEKYQGREGQKPGDIQGDGPQGAMTSAEFVINMKQISLLIGGGSNPQAGVDLIVNGKSVFKAQGQDNESMERIVWDVSAYRGQKARIRAVDEASGGNRWGHINFDDIIFEY